MTCNLNSYLREQEITCLRIAKSCNEGTLPYAEWLRTAQMLLERRQEHVKICQKCSKD